MYTDIAVIGAGPVGLFMAFQAGMLNMKTTIIDCLDVIGGQCSTLYPEKPIYDIPAYPMLTGQELTDNLAKQAAPFAPEYVLGELAVKIEKTESGFRIITDKNTTISCKAIVIASGSGAFGPNRPPIDNIEEFENKSVFYSVSQKEIFRNKKVVIAGGGDSAVDWAIALTEIAQSVVLVHRRDKFRCSPNSKSQLDQLVKMNKIEITTPYQLHQLSGSGGILNSITLIDLDNQTKIIEADALLAFFGLSMNLGPIKEWGLDFAGLHIKVDPSNFRTNIKGIYAVGDVCTYPGKLKLILNGFGECSMAAHDIYHLVNPDKALHFEYSTTKGIKI